MHQGILHIFVLFLFENTLERSPVAVPSVKNHLLCHSFHLGHAGINFMHKGCGMWKENFGTFLERLSQLSLVFKFFGPQMALAYRLDAFSQGPKNCQFPGPNPLPLALVMDMHTSKTLCTGGCINHRCINSYYIWRPFCSPGGVESSFGLNGGRHQKENMAIFFNFL